MIDQPDKRKSYVQATKPVARAEPKSQYIYHWDRIIGALAVFGLLIGLIGFGLYTWLRPSLPPASVGLEKAQGQEETLVEAAPQSGGAVQESLPPLRAPAIVAGDRQTGPAVPAKDILSPGAVSDPPQSRFPPELELQSTPQQPAGEYAAVDLPRLAADEALPYKPPAPPAVVDTAPAQIPVDEEDALPSRTQEIGREKVADGAAALTPAAESDGGEQPNMGREPLGEDRPESSAAVAPDTPVGVGSESASEPGPGVDRAVADNLNETSEEGHLRSGTTSVASPVVKRFVLAQSVANNEPKGNLGDILPNSRGYAEVYSYSEVIGLEGEVLEYRWLHEGEQVLKIRVPVGAERWRSHSTKRIYQRMTGAWRAELRDSAGNLLASIDFVY